MQIRLYLDEDTMSRSLARELRARGVDVTTTISEDMLRRDDGVQLEFAKAQGQVILTYNVGDYYNLHTKYLMEGKAPAVIILAHQRRYTVGEQIRRILKLMGTVSAEDMQNRAEYLSAWG